MADWAVGPTEEITLPEAGPKFPLHPRIVTDVDPVVGVFLVTAVLKSGWSADMDRVRDPTSLMEEIMKLVELPDNLEVLQATDVLDSHRLAPVSELPTAKLCEDGKIAALELVTVTETLPVAG